jgi:WD40 repeat protein
VAGGQTLSVWDWQARQKLASFDNEVPAVTLALSPDETLLAAGTANDVRLWSIPESGFAHLLEAGGRGVDVMQFSPDGRFLLNGGQIPNMQLWDPQTGQQVGELPGVGQDRVSAAFSPDSTMVVTSVLGGPVNLWNLSSLTGDTINNAQLDTGDTLIYRVDWTADSYLLTLFGATGSVYLWGIPAETS